MNTDNRIESYYTSDISLQHRKKYAQFFTPAKIADIMTEWLVGNKELHHVLEPAFGLGIFSRILLSKNKNITITGYDIDNVIYARAKDLFKSESNINIILSDYIDSNWSKKYDGIICNPPYFKFHDYDNKRVVSSLNEKLNVKLSLSTNLYVLFLLKSINQLNRNGRCAYIIPSEFMNSDYGVVVKKCLIESKKVRHIITFNFNDKVFDDALTTSAIILCANDDKTENISFSYIESLAELEKVNQIIQSYPDVSNSDFVYHVQDIDSDIKWRNYYQPRDLQTFNRLVPFAAYAKVMRGVATGANEYFSFNQSKIKNYGISMEDLQPCICHSADIRGFCFTDDDFECLLNMDKNVFILNPRDKHDKMLEEYIKKGEREKINERYLTSKRTPWYSMEKRSPAPIWVNVFNRKGLRFIRNETSTINLTTFHCIYLNQNMQDVDADLFFAYLMSNTAKMIFSAYGREYGNGLNKFEPNDLNKSSILDIGTLSDSDKNTMRNIYLSNKNNDDMSFIDDIDAILIDNFCSKCC